MRWLVVCLIGCGGTERSAFDSPAEWSCDTSAPIVTKVSGQLREVPSGFAKSFKYRVCKPTDLTCDAPVASGEGARIDATLPEGGFLEIDRKTLVWPTPAPVLGSLPPSFLGPPYLPNRGHLMVRMIDCDARDAEGVALTVQGADDKSIYYYFEGSGFTTAATDTNSTGLAAVQQVPAGTVTVVASVFGKTIGERQIAIRAGAVSTLEFRGIR